MRNSCLNCARKHLACAAILMHEARFGYPDHMWLAIGHLNEAETELADEYPMIALGINEHRKAYEDSDGEYPVPIMEIIGECSAKATALRSKGVPGTTGTREEFL